MVDPSNNNSFIPKRGPAKLQRTNAAKQVYVFTIISYILMFSSLLSAGGVFLYSKYFVEKQREEVIVELNTAISSFSEEDMQKVIDFDRRLQQASDRVDNSIALGSLFNAFEEATVATVWIDSLSLEREKDDKLVLEASVMTDSFDSILFQRGVFKSNQIIDSIVITEVAKEDTKEESSDDSEVFTFKAGFEVPITSVPYEAVDLLINNESKSVPDINNGDTELDEDILNNSAVDNQENI